MGFLKKTAHFEAISKGKNNKFQSIQIKSNFGVNL